MVAEPENPAEEEVVPDPPGLPSGSGGVEGLGERQQEHLLLSDGPFTSICSTSRTDFLTIFSKLSAESQQFSEFLRK